MLHCWRLQRQHQTWSPHSTTNQCGRVLNKFIKNCGFLLSYSSQPTIVPYRSNQRPATIDFGISCGLDDILVETQTELSSDHNPVQFIIPEANNSPYDKTAPPSPIGINFKNY
ncbi:hypothetical protein TNCT_603111 [Trichonephila clavata]|uniref:Endonuclease/exonuclease/phosphatase domain-containing protein n=1 Tax=Trichonephila clavata TaxID=2740835 RepID=A0A8X6F263_TRICU|nr:hypothetical protein TNCT_603111 [Trichonephila clavata]